MVTAAAAAAAGRVVAVRGAAVRDVGRIEYLLASLAVLVVRVCWRDGGGGVVCDCAHGKSWRNTMEMRMDGECEIL